MCLVATVATLMGAYGKFKIARDLEDKEPLSFPFVTFGTSWDGTGPLTLLERSLQGC